MKPKETDVGLRDITQKSPQDSTPKYGEDHWYDRPHWYQRQVVEITVIVMAFFVITLPWVVSVHNGYPNDAELETIHATILKTSRLDPHLIVALEDGTKMTMEFPVYISGRSSMAFYGWSTSDRKRLVGCEVEVKGIWLEWTVFERFRVWELKCPAKNIVIDRATTEEQFEFARQSDFSDGLVLAVYLPLLAALIAVIKEIIFRYRKGS